MKKIFFLFTFAMLTIILAHGQTTKKPISDKVLMTGYQYLLSTNGYTPFKYSRIFSISGDRFITTYQIYHPRSGKHTLTITATHYKAEKKVEVMIENPNGGIFSEINKEKTTYETPSMEKFGFRGSVGSLGGKNVPNQLALKFASIKYENVKVVNVLGSHENDDFEFFILDEK